MTNTANINEQADRIGNTFGQGEVYIYGLVDPRTDEYRYVGQTTNLKKRYNGHMSLPDNSQKWIWISELKSLGLAPEMLVLETTSPEKGNQREAHWMNLFKKLGADLVNTKYRNKPFPVKHLTFQKDDEGRSLLPVNEELLKRISNLGDKLGLDELETLEAVLRGAITLSLFPLDTTVTLTDEKDRFVMSCPIRSLL